MKAVIFTSDFKGKTAEFSDVKSGEVMDVQDNIALALIHQGVAEYHVKEEKVKLKTKEEKSVKKTK